MLLTRIAALVLLLTVAGCGREGGSPIAPPLAPTGVLSAQARVYLDQLIGFMQANSIKRFAIDWDSFRTRVIGEAGGAQTIADTYPAIRVALSLLGDGHSSYRSSSGTTIFVPNRSCSGSGAGTPTLPDTIGYVRVGAFSGSGAEAVSFATTIQNAIGSADRDGLIGWIVDLRGNGGGNMWPMVAGLGPVLGEGLLGFFINPVGVESAWEYRDGASWNSGFAQVRVAAPYRLRRERPRVAVLTDNAVASSGEATVIAFRQRPDTRSFGMATCGLSTANSGFTMSDGALLNLTVSVMADRIRTRYGDSIPPDEIVSGASDTVDRAVAWLRTGS